jgi:hypothetical protein
MFDVMSLKQVGEVIYTEIRKRKKTNRKKRGEVQKILGTLTGMMY